MIKTQVQEIEPNKVALMVEVAKEKVTAAYSQFFLKAAQSVQIPGFRKGKIPRPVLVKHIGADAIRDQISDELVHSSYPEAVRSAKIHPVSPGKIEETNLQEGEAFTFKAVVEVRPKLPDFSYTQRQATVKRIEADDESVGKVISKLQEQFGKLQPVEEGGVLELEDYFLGKIEARIDGELDSELSEEKAYRKFNDTNKMLMPMQGMKHRETRTFTYLANDERDKGTKYEGKTIEYTVTIDKFSRPQISALNDDFAKEVGDYKSFDDLKTKIREDLEDRFRKDADTRAIDVLLEQINGEVTMDVPDAMVNRTIDYFIESLGRKWRQYGTSVEDYLKKAGKSMEEFREGFREKAVYETRIMLIVDTISEREKVEIGDAEYHAEVEKRAKEYNVPVEKLMSYFSTAEGRDFITNSMLKEKINEFLLKNNQIHYDMVSESEFNKGDSGDAGTHSH